MVLFGIKVEEQNIIYYLKNAFDTGEANSVYDLGKYPCTFSTLIGDWRQTWNERTNGNTDIQFPFGFVQVSSIT